jgi:hypothetical protein
MASPSCTLEEITPDDAKRMLHINHKNRRLSPAQVTRLAGVITRGEWMEDSTDGIGLDVDGGVINGQHRLQAIIEADTPVRALVVRNVRPEVIKVIDQGVNRNLAQILAMDGGYAYPPILAASVNWLYRIIRGLERTVPTALKPTTPQLLDLLIAHRNIEVSLDMAQDVYRSMRTDRGMLTAYHYTCASADSAMADDFYDQLATGAELTPGSPVHVLRERIATNNAAQDSKKANTVEVAAWLVKAWEAARQGTSITSRQLRWVRSGSRAERFPQVSGVPWLDPDNEEEYLSVGDDAEFEDSDDLGEIA